MAKRHFFLYLILFAGMQTQVRIATAQENVQGRHALVAIRMIGHQLLLHSGDSTSRVFPIEKQGDRYRITFQSPFQFEPEDLVGLIDSIVRQSGIAEKYLVEVESCETQQVVYSYEMGYSAKSEMIPCSGRVQPKACYTVFFTILHAGDQMLTQQPSDTKHASFFSDATGKLNFFTIGLPFAALILLAIVFYKQKKSKVLPIGDTDLITIGAYQFDKRNMTLSHDHNTIELTGKEADLLYLLHGSANITIERETILHEVWGDEGDYAGRTLDVFISKLRKKLEADESLKIVNIRGVGYKLIVNG